MPKRRPRGKGTPRASPRGLQTAFVPFAGSSTPRHGGNGFTLQEEARNTERHHSFWDSGQKLRHSKINFVSAGKLDPSESKEAEEGLAKMSLESPKAGPKYEVEIDVKIEEETGPEDRGLFRQPTQEKPLPLFSDMQGTGPIQTGLPSPHRRSISPAVSNSSEEVILFAGRDTYGKAITRESKFSTKPSNPIDTKVRIVEDMIHEQEDLLEDALHFPDNTTPMGQTESLSPDFEAILPRHRDQLYGEEHMRQTNEDELLADYIANMDQEVSPLPKFFNSRELGGAEHATWHQEIEHTSGEPSEDPKPFQGGWKPSEMCDFDDLSTSDGVMGHIQAILSKRERNSGVQYLVVWEDQSVDEARWVPEATLTNLGATSHIHMFETKEQLVAEFVEDNEEDCSESDDADDDLYVDDEQDLVQRKISRMTDEQIARLLAKQEELGMGSNEILLFDDDADAEDEGTSIPRFKPILRASGVREKGKGIKKPLNGFTTAPLSDAYAGFDIIDFDRASLQRQPKDRRGRPAFDLSDSDLGESMQLAWASDRASKKEKKQQREELRSQGLLGRKSRKPDLKAKYKEGMSFDAVKEEIKTFLVSTNTTRLALPPMDKANRKLIHELANAFNLKSKSAGTGQARFPVLYRTLKTSAYIERTFTQVEQQLSRRFLPRSDIRGKKSNNVKKSTRGGGFNSAAVSYRDGDIVGGSAPELGVENKGRAMLEKMGWSSGTALGAINNKGILQPVSHIVRTTKAGLG
ncbi:hypothetical protein B7494_g7078 [Chlorociboria aeruginascens]|nr:hypothetical protein B7494_g7078 [Chlorociboria aeruginascens]